MAGAACSRFGALVGGGVKVAPLESIAHRIPDMPAAFARIIQARKQRRHGAGKIVAPAVLQGLGDRGQRLRGLPVVCAMLARRLALRRGRGQLYIDECLNCAAGNLARNCAVSAAMALDQSRRCACRNIFIDRYQGVVS